MTDISFFSQSLSQVAATFEKHGVKKIHAQALYSLVYKKRQFVFEQKDFENNKVLDILPNYNFSLPKIVKVQKASDKTTKFLLEMSDGLKIETVLIPFHRRYTVCLSSQVGCAMNCSFCYTGTQGLKRNLLSHEIIGQYLVAWQWLKDNIPDKSICPNIVFMGQGEPLHNFDELKKAIEIMLTTEGLHLGPRQITVSTAGYLPGILKLPEMPRVNVALSLHSPNDNVRNELIPLNKSYNLEKIFAALDKIPLMKRQFINYEYLVIKDLNDSNEFAYDLGNLLKNRRAIVNLIPFNEFPDSPYKRPDMEQVDRFKEILGQYGIATMVRRTKGDDILAACGQLKVLDEITQAKARERAIQKV